MTRIFTFQEERRELRGKMNERRVRPAGPGGGASAPPAQLVSLRMMSFVYTRVGFGQFFFFKEENKRNDMSPLLFALIFFCLLSRPTQMLF
jgi:hypothetical protein